MKYQLVGEDDKVFKIKHPDGSEFHIAKKAIGPEVHKRIKALKMADGGEVPENDSLDVEQLPDESQAPLDIAPVSNQELASQNIPNQQNPLIIEPMDRTPAVEQPAQAPVSAPTNPTDLSSDYAKIFAKESTGIKGVQSAKANEAATQAKIYKEAADQIAQNQKNYQDEHAKLDTEHSQIIKAIMDNKIDPNRYFGNMNTGNKIIAAISIALSGIGSGLTGKPNMAMNVIQNSIDRDIEAQKLELGKKNTLLSENLRRFGDLNTATQMTQLQYNAATQAKIAQAVAQSGTQQARYEGDILLAGLDKQAAQMKQQFTLNRLLMGQGGSNPDSLISYLRIADPAKAKEMEARYVPGVGIGSVPVPDKIREELSAREGLQQQVGKLRQWAKDHEGSLNPEDISYGKALANSVQDAYRRANGQGVFREAESEFVKGIVEQDPTKFLNSFRVDPKYKALEDSNLVELNSRKKSYGLPEQTSAQRLSPQEQSYLQWAKQNPQDPRSAAVLKKLGMQ